MQHANVRPFCELQLPRYFQAGPESAGAHPGPVCYRKGGYLAITDANLLLGRILPDFFPKIFGPNEDEPLDGNAARSAGTAASHVLWI